MPILQTNREGLNNALMESDEARYPSSRQVATGRENGLKAGSYYKSIDIPYITPAPGT
jgi:hypothetical protein